MSSGEDTGHQMDDITSKNGSLSSMPLTTESSQPRQTQSTQQNIYTPLSLTPHLEYSQISSVTDEAISKEVTVLSNVTDNGINGKSKANSSARCPAVKNQRSSVRPFFCCGSELSLVSLVDGMEIKDESPNEKKIQSIECYSSSGDEALESTPFRSRSNTMGTIDIARPSVVRRKKKDKHVVKKKFWSLRLQSKWSPGWRSRQSQRSKCSRDFSQQSITSGCSASFSGAGPSNFNRQSPAALSASTAASSGPFLDLFNFFPVEGIADAAIRRRNEEMAVGIEIGTQALTRAFRSNIDMSGSMMDILRMRSRLSPANSDILRSSDSPIEDLLMNNLISQVQNPRGSIESWGGLAVPQIHTQIDYVHYLVPDLAKITSCSYYWGIMDRYEAEHLLENKPPGTFLLRDSAQEDFLFSVSFRRYNRSLHARIEQWNHRFSFDAHDPSVFSAITVCELMEHYKDPSLCMFFEPMLTRPLHRTFPFSLQHMSRTMICDRISYDDIQTLPLPNSFKKYLQTYHYKQKVRVRRFDAPDMMASADSRVM